MKMGFKWVLKRMREDYMQSLLRSPAVKEGRRSSRKWFVCVRAGKITALSCRTETNEVYRVVVGTWGTSLTAPLFSAKQEVQYQLSEDKRSAGGRLGEEQFS